MYKDNGQKISQGVHLKCNDIFIKVLCELLNFIAVWEQHTHTNTKRKEKRMKQTNTLGINKIPSEWIPNEKRTI